MCNVRIAPLHTIYGGLTMELNIFKYPSCRSRLMIRNLDDAQAFISQCKNLFHVRLDVRVHWIEIEKGSATVYRSIDSWTCFEEEHATGNDAAKLIYKYRKYINAKFKD